MSINVKKTIENTIDDLQTLLEDIEDTESVICPWTNMDGINCRYKREDNKCSNIWTSPCMFDAWCMKRMRLAESVIVWMKGYKDDI